MKKTIDKENARVQEILALSGLNRRAFVKLLAYSGATAATLGFSWKSKLFANQKGVVRLRLLETSDVHVHIHSYDYYRDSQDNKVGLSKVATLLQQARNEAPNSLFFDNGDFLQGNPMGDFIAYEKGMKGGDLHPIIKAMNVLNYDVATLGNHEFNYGLSFLEKVLAGSKFPFVCANVVKGKLASKITQDKTLIKPYVIVEKKLVDESGLQHSIKIGVIGFVPPQIMNWDRFHLQNKVNARDIYQTCRAYVPEMKEAGADLIFALSHSGIGNVEIKDNEENASSSLGLIDGIDAIFTGHHHLVFPSNKYDGLNAVDVAKGTLNGVPAVMPGFWGSHLGMIDLTLSNKNGKWMVLEGVPKNIPIYKRDGRKVISLVKEDAKVLNISQKDHDNTLTYIRTPVGKISDSINSYFATVADDPSVQIVSKAQIWYVGDLIKGTKYKELPVLSAAAPFKAGGRGGPDYYTDVSKGDIAIKNVADLYLYPNTVRAVKVNGETVKEWLERSSGLFLQIKANVTEAQNLINDNFPSYNFDVIDGVTYQIDVSQPARYSDKEGKLVNPQSHRIVNLKYKGKAIDPKQEFIVATNNYRASGGGNFPKMDGTNIIIAAPDTNRDVIVRYIVNQGVVSPTADENWKFSKVKSGKNGIYFLSSPNARKYLKRHSNITFLKVQEDGFAKYKINIG